MNLLEQKVRELKIERAKVREAREQIQWKVVELQRQIDLLKLDIDVIDEPAKVLQDEISAIIALDYRRTIKIDGVEIKYNKGRASTSWKTVALAMNPPQTIIDENTSFGEPTCTFQFYVE